MMDFTTLLGKTRGSFQNVIGNINLKRTADGSFEGLILDGDFIITDTRNNQSVTLNANFTEGDFGIRFHDQAPADLPTVYYTATESAERILGGGEVYALGGNDIVLGQADLAAAPIEVLQGDGGDVTLYSGDTQLATDIAIANGNTDAGTGPYGDWLAGGAGDDRIWGGNDDDYLDGGDSKDTLVGGAGNNVVIGGAGDDVLYGGEDNDYLDGGDGNDTLWGGNGNDVLDGGDGTNTLIAEGGSNTLYGGSGNVVTTRMRWQEAANDHEYKTQPTRSAA